MKKLLLPLVAAAALALPASAFAWGGGHDEHHGDFHIGLAGVTKLSGTGTTFGGTSATASGTGFTASLSTTWSSATSKTFSDDDGDSTDGSTTVSCAPSTASIALGGQAAVGYSGRTCSWTRNGTTTYAFMGRASNGPAAFLKEDGTTVAGAVYAGSIGLHMGVFAALRSGNCDGH
ncbi:MAG: hypothetical protein KGI93_10335 [Acidobacteriota bacterium]|nr:hypothetical protein [Acidobacteriota bacterium]